MLLYHGSDHVIKRPEFGAGKKHNDYGRGFYCTENIELAKEWAVSEDADGYVNKYSIDTSRLSILDINSEEYTMLHWLGILRRIFWRKNESKSYPHHPRHNTSSGGSTFHNISKSRNTNVWHSIISGWCIGSCAVIT